jgi:hypothetical protein
MGNDDWGAGIFWLFIAAAVVAGAWEKVRKNAEKHETLRRIIEKTGTVDEAKLKELFNPPAGSDWLTSRTGDAYRALQITGVIFLSIAAGLAVFFLAMHQGDVISQKVSIIGLSAAGAVATFGLGFFIASRFTAPPPPRGNEPPAR